MQVPAPPWRTAKSGRPGEHGRGAAPAQNGPVPAEPCRGFRLRPCRPWRLRAPDTVVLAGPASGPWMLAADGGGRPFAAGRTTPAAQVLAGSATG